MLKLDLGPSRGILCGSQLQREWDGRCPRPRRMSLGSCLYSAGFRNFGCPASLDYGDQHARRDRRLPSSNVVGDTADDSRMRLYLPVRPCALPAAHAGEACETHSGVCGGEEHRFAGHELAAKARLAFLARAAGPKRGESRAAGRAAAKSRRGATCGGARQVGRSSISGSGKRRAAAAVALCAFATALGHGRWRYRFVLFAGDGSPAPRAGTASTRGHARRRTRQGVVAVSSRLRSRASSSSVPVVVGTLSLPRERGSGTHFESNEVCGIARFIMYCILALP